MRSYHPLERDGDYCEPLRRGHKELRPGGPMALRYYVRARLHRRLFFTLGISILIMLTAAFSAVHFMFPRGDFPAQMTALENLFSEQFAKAWPEPKERERLATATSQAFGVALTLKDDRGNLLSNHGGGCKQPKIALLITRDGKGLGEVLGCSPKTASETRNALLAGFLAAAFVLWLVAGYLAHRLGRPLWQLAQVTREIGAGRLESRARLGRHQPGEVGVLAESINDMAERIEKQIGDQRELLAAVSHEIRTPLARLRVLSELLRDSNAPESMLTSLEREIEEINDLTGQLLATSRLDFGNLQKRTIDLRELVTDSLERMNLPTERFESAAGVDFEALVDPTLLSRALTNLLHNAITHGDGVRGISLTQDDGKFRFEIRDEGPGIPQQDLGRVFEPFVRGEGSKKSSSSLGLGLALVRRIARAHGGDAFAANAADGGGIVGLWIPSGKAPAP